MGFVVARSQCTRFDHPWVFKYDSQQRSIATRTDVAADNVLSGCPLMQLTVIRRRAAWSFTRF